MSAIHAMWTGQSIVCSFVLVTIFPLLCLSPKENYKKIQKSYHLESGEVLLPPNVLLVSRSHRRHHVVEIHDDVDKRVEQGEKCAMTTCDRHKHVFE